MHPTELKTVKVGLRVVSSLPMRSQHDQQSRTTFDVCGGKAYQNTRLMVCANKALSRSCPIPEWVIWHCIVSPSLPARAENKKRMLFYL